MPPALPLDARLWGSGTGNTDADFAGPGRRIRLGNLWDTIGWVAPEQAPTLSFLDERWTSLEEWKAARGTFHDAPHSFPPSMQAEAFGWLERWL